MARRKCFVGNDLKKIKFYFPLWHVWHNKCIIYIVERKKRGFIMLSFDNGICKTENETLNSGRVITHIDNVRTGERICFVDNQADLAWSIDKLMRQRLGV